MSKDVLWPKRPLYAREEIFGLLFGFIDSASRGDKSLGCRLYHEIDLGLQLREGF